VIQGINSQGWALPPFVIFKGKQYQSTWFDEDFPEDWQLSLSSNGWTTNQHGLEWLKHFDLHTISRSKGQKRLLIIDAHESHKSSEFIDYCSQNNIIILWMPSHASHLL
jgi:succinylglutamate desuccinylase